MQTHQIQVFGGRDKVHEIRDELFSFPEVLEVFTTGRPDSLVVVCSGRPRPARWLDALTVAGYHVTPRRHASVTSDPPSRDGSGARPAGPPPRPHAHPPILGRRSRQVL